jgi:hypothetical protein
MIRNRNIHRNANIAASKLAPTASVTAGTVAASKAVIADANKDITGFRNVTATGTVKAATQEATTSLKVGATTLNEAEVGVIDGVTAGAVSASKAVVADSSKDVSGFRNVTATGAVSSASTEFTTHAGPSWTDTADGTIPAYRLAEIDASEDLVVGTVDSHSIVGVNLENDEKEATETVKLGTGRRTVTAATPVKAGKPIKGADNGRVTQLVDANVTGTTIGSGNGSAFTNQPQNDGVTVVSTSESDTAITVTIIGTTTGTETVVTEDIVLTGIVDADSVKKDWGAILGVKLSGAAVGDVKVSETSEGLEIVTIAAGGTSAGVVAVDAGDQGAFNVAPTSEADDTTTKTIGIKYIATDGSTEAYQADALNGATAQTFANAALLVTELYLGDVESTRTVTVKVGAQEDVAHKIGKAYTAAAAAGDSITAILTP